MTTNSTGGNSRMTDEALDPFDLASLRLDQTYSDGIAVKKLITMIRVGKPQKQHFVRVNPDPAYRISPVAIIELKDDRESLLGVADIGGGTCGRVHIGRAVHRHHAGRHLVSLAGAVAGAGREA